MSLVWEVDLQASQKIVLLALADCANDEGNAWPSVATLARKSSKSERTVQMMLAELEAAGHITRRQVSGKGCNYDVHPRKNCAPAEFAPAQISPEPPQELHPTPAESAPNPSKNHQEPSKDTSTDADRLTSDEVFEGWNNLAGRCGLQAVAKRTDARTRSIRRMAKAYPVDDWVSVFAKIEQSPFLKGTNDRGWRCDIDFLLNEKNFVKILEGKYDRQ